MRLPLPIMASCLVSFLMASLPRTLAQPDAPPPTAADVPGEVKGSRSFEIPAADASESLASFSRQSGGALVYVVEQVRGVRTQGIRGHFRPRDALERLLANTDLTVAEDRRTGALIVRRSPSSKSSERGALPVSSRPETSPSPNSPMTPSLMSRLAAALAAFSGTALSAQPASTGGPNATKDETVQLSPFTVVSEKEYGYRATNSITATGIGSEIYRTPISISVVTSDLIRDLGAGSLREALLYSTSVTGDRRDPGSSGTGGSAMRGFATQLLVNRLSASVRNPVPYFIERVEIVKGPNAVFFGRVAPNGVLNVITLKPKSTTETVAHVTYGSYDFVNLFLDQNLKLGDRVSLRLAGNWLDQRSGSYDHTYRRSESGYAALKWDFTSTISLNVTASIDHGKENKLSVSPRTNPAYIAFTRANPNSTLGLIQWGAQFVAPNTPVVTDYYNDLYDPTTVFPSGVRGNNNGPDAFQEDWNTFVQTELVGTFSDGLSARLAHAYGDNEFEILEHIGYPTFNGTFNLAAPNFRGTKTRGNTLEAEAVASFSLLGSRHQILLGGRLYFPRTGSFAAAGRAYTWNHLTQGPRRLIRDGYPNGLVKPRVVFASGNETALYVIDQISLWDDKAKLLAGVRRTEVKNNTGLAGAVTLAQTETTPQVGILVEPVKGWALFGNYSRSFEPQFNVDAEGKLATNVEGEGYEFGIKSQLLDGRLSGTVSYFDLTRKGEVRRDFARETLTGKVPLFIPGGTQAAHGAEIELYFNPKPNLQFIFNYTRLWEANVTQDITQPFIVGARLRNAPPYSSALWTRYTVPSGRMQGLFFTGGVRASGEITPIVNALFSIRQPGYVNVDAGVGYEGRILGRPVTIGLNVKNVLDREFYDGQWTLADPRTAYLKVESRF